MGHPHRLRRAGRARREDQHEQVVRIGPPGSVDRRPTASPASRSTQVDVGGEHDGHPTEVEAVEQRRQCSASVITSWQSVWRMSRASSAPRRVLLMPTTVAAGEGGAEEREQVVGRVVEQHADVERAGTASRDEPAGHGGAALDHLAPGPAVVAAPAGRSPSSSARPASSSATVVATPAPSADPGAVTERGPA